MIKEIEAYVMRRDSEDGPQYFISELSYGGPAYSVVRKATFAVDIPDEDEHESE